MAGLAGLPHVGFCTLHVGAAFSRDSRLQGAYALPGAPTEKIISGIAVKQSGPHHPVRAAAG
jgi:hypothetical protein